MTKLRRVSKPKDQPEAQEATLPMEELEQMETPSVQVSGMGSQVSDQGEDPASPLDVEEGHNLLGENGQAGGTLLVNDATTLVPEYTAESQVVEVATPTDQSSDVDTQPSEVYAYAPSFTESVLDEREGEGQASDIGSQALDTEENPTPDTQHPTPAVDEAEPEDLTPLPLNAVVDGRYLVQTQLHHSADRNLYRVTARSSTRCGVCGRPSDASAEVCTQCGSALDGQTPAEFYLMAESYRPEALIQDAGLMDLHIYHPNLVPVIDFFNYKPFGRTRYFAVAEPRPGVRLSQMSLPRPGAQVLNWAMQLADALDYLHNKGAVGAGAEADDILVQGDRASLASLQNARTNVTEMGEKLQQQTMDLARLAATIYEAYTGNPAMMGPEGVLPMPPGAPEQVGGAFRAALEPVQGAAPPISAAQWRNMLATAVDAVSELERPGRPVDFVAVGLTDVGRLREQNQDSFGIAEFVQGSAERPMRVGLFIVADGLGGHKGGEIASALAVQAFSGELLGRIVAPLVALTAERVTPGNEAILQGMTRAVQAANDRIYKARNNSQNDMGTTLVAMIISGGKAYIVNVGDSRLYMYTKREGYPSQQPEANTLDSTRPLVKGTSPLAGTLYLRRGEIPDSSELESVPRTADNEGYSLVQVSVDHSLVHRLVEMGQLNPEEAKVHPHRNFIYRSLGGAPPIEVDTFVRTLHPGDRILLCSDGLNSMLEDSEVEEVLATEDDPHLVCQRLIDMANEAGGHDNITVVLVDVQAYLPLAEHPFVLDNA